MSRCYYKCLNHQIYQISSIDYKNKIGPVVPNGRWKKHPRKRRRLVDSVDPRAAGHNLSSGVHAAEKGGLPARAGTVPFFELEPGSQA
jgi:hypothetical protein